MAGKRARHLSGGSPLLMLRALDAPQSVSAIEDQKLGNQSLPAVVFDSGLAKYIIMFDRATKLPAAVRTRDEDNIWGDANYDDGRCCAVARCAWRARWPRAAGPHKCFPAVPRPSPRLASDPSCLR
jgi:hypothetical protein